MKLFLSAVRASLAKNLSPEVGAAILNALDKIDGGSARPDIADVSAALVLALFPTGPDGIENLPLRSVRLACGGTTVELEPGLCASHPLLRDWAPPTLAAAIGQVILAGAAMTNLAPGAPRFRDIALRAVRPGEILGIATLSFRTDVDAHASLFYGVPVEEMGFCTVHQVSGDALFLIGSESSVTPVASHALEQDALREHAATAAYAGTLADTLEMGRLH